LSKQAFATNLSSASEKICDAKKPAISAVVEVADKKTEQVEEEAPAQQSSSSFRKLSAEPKAAALIEHEPIHYHILAPNEPHPCDKYTGAQEKPNTNSATATIATIRQSAISKKSPINAVKRGLG
jgi:hypothetical protein